MKSVRAYTMGSRADGVVDTRERIVRGALKLFVDQWPEDVTLSGIARAAGVSHQTVLNHFDSKEGVYRAAAEIAGRETRGRRAEAVPGDVRSAVTALVAEYERLGDANVRWAVTSDRLPSLAPLLADARAAHQRWLEAMFAAKIPRTPAARRHAISALHAATDVYTWKLLRRDLGLGRAETERTMIILVSGVLNHSSGEDQ